MPTTVANSIKGAATDPKKLNLGTDRDERLRKLIASEEEKRRKANLGQPGATGATETITKRIKALQAKLSGNARPDGSSSGANAPTSSGGSGGQSSSASGGQSAFTAPGVDPTKLPGAGGDGSLSPEDELNALSQDLFGEDAVPSSLDQRVEELKAKQERERQEQARQLEIQRKLDRQATERNIEGLESGAEAAKATLSQGREGVQSTSQPLALREFQDTVGQKVEEAKLRLEQAEFEKQNLERRLLEAQKAERTTEVIDIQKDIDRQRVEAANAEKALIEARQESNEAAQALMEDARGQVNDFIDSLGGPEKLASLDVNTVTSYVQSIASISGLDSERATMLTASTLARHSLSQEIADKIKSGDESGASGLLQLFKSLDIAPPESVKSIEALNYMRANPDRFTDEDIRAFKLKTGLTEEPTKGNFEIRGDAKSGYVIFDKNQGKVTNSIPGSSRRSRTTRGSSSVVAMPKGQKYKADYIPSSDPRTSGRVSLDVTDGEFGGQCGFFCNDVMAGEPGERLFGDTLKSKTDRVNTEVPAPGSYFVMDVGTPEGHVGFVEQVHYDDKGNPISIDIVDSNWHLDEKWDRRNIILQGNAMIEGFYDPSLDPNYNAGAVVDGLSQGLSSDDRDLVESLKKEYNLAKTDSAKDKVLSEAIDLGLLDAFDAAVGGGTEKTPEELLKFVNVRKSLPTRLVDSEQDREGLQTVVDAFPHLTSTEITRRFIIGEDYEKLDEGTRNIADQIVDISTGISAEFNDAGVIQQVKRGNFLGAINTTEQAKIREVVDEQYQPANVEKNLRLIQQALDLVEETDQGFFTGGIGKIQGNQFRLSQTAGLSNPEIQRIESLLTWMISPTRVEIAGSNVTESEAKSLEPILPSITDPEDNLKAKLEILKDSYLTGYNSARSAAGLIELDAEDIQNPQRKVDKYKQGKTLQSQTSGSWEKVIDDYDDPISDILSKYDL